VVRRQQLELDLLKVNTTFPLPDLPNQPRDCYQIIGEGESASRRCYAYDFVASNPMN
jgi:hypothetical protein